MAFGDTGLGVGEVEGNELDMVGTGTTRVVEEVNGGLDARYVSTGGYDADLDATVSKDLGKVDHRDHVARGEERQEENVEIHGDLTGEELVIFGQGGTCVEERGRFGLYLKELRTWPILLYTKINAPHKFMHLRLDLFHIQSASQNILPDILKNSEMVGRVHKVPHVKESNGQIPLICGE